MKLYLFTSCIFMLCTLWSTKGRAIDSEDQHWDVDLTNSDITDNKGNLLINGNKNMYVLSIDAGFFSKDIEEECNHCRYVYYDNQYYLSCQFKTRDYANRKDPLTTYEFRIDFIELPDIKYSKKPDCKLNGNSKFTNVDLYNSNNKKINIIGKDYYDKFKTRGYIPLQNDNSFEYFIFKNDDCEIYARFKNIT
eukprot:jgi/Orpsp1_1/1174748/evm.model.c7180000051244.1